MLIASVPDLGIARKKVLAQLQGEVFDTLGLALAGTRIDRVLHGIGGQDGAVIAIGEAGLEVAGEQNLDLPFPHCVQRAVALHLHHAHARFSVRIFCQSNHRLAPSVGGIAIWTQEQWDVQVGIAGAHGHRDLNRQVQTLDRLCLRDRSRFRIAAGIGPAAEPVGCPAAEGWRTGHRYRCRCAAMVCHSPDRVGIFQMNHHARRRHPSAVSSTWVERRLTQPPFVPATCAT